MITYFKLSTTIDPDDQVDFIANTTKGNYVNLRGVNAVEVQNSLIEFLIDVAKAWTKGDKVIRTKKPLAYKPTNVHDISFVVNIYNMGYKSQEYKKERAKQESKSTKAEMDPNVQSINQNLQTIHVQQLANKNINHSTNVESDPETQIIQTEGDTHTELEIPSELEIKSEPKIESVVDERSNTIEMPSYSRRGKKITASKQAKMDQLLNEETEPYGLIKIVNRGKGTITPKIPQIDPKPKISKSVIPQITAKPAPKKPAGRRTRTDSDDSEHKLSQKKFKKKAAPKRGRKEKSISEEESSEEEGEESEESEEDSGSEEDAESGEEESGSEEESSEEVSDNESVEISEISPQVELKKNPRGRPRKLPLKGQSPAKPGSKNSKAGSNLPFRGQGKGKTTGAKSSVSKSNKKTKPRQKKQTNQRSSKVKSKSNRI
jgi:hypothetical protein